MNWSSFFVTIFAIYFIYYAVNIVMDLTGKGQKTEKEDLETLSFQDDYQPKKVDFDDSKTDNSPLDKKVEIEEKTIPILVEEQKKSVAINEDFKERKEENEKTEVTGISGGVGYKELFNLAKTGAIEKTRTIAFN